MKIHTKKFVPKTRKEEDIISPSSWSSSSHRTGRGGRGSQGGRGNTKARVTKTVVNLRLISQQTFDDS